MNAYTKTPAQSKEIGAPDVETLKIMADWKADMRSRYERAQLVFELVGGNGEEVAAISREMAQFSAVCKVLKAVSHA